jgi:hypothetical protein
MRGALSQQSEWILPRMIWYSPTDSYQKIFESFFAEVLTIPLSNASIVCGASTTYLYLPSVFFFGEDL